MNCISHPNNPPKSFLEGFNFFSASATRARAFCSFSLIISTDFKFIKEYPKPKCSLFFKELDQLRKNVNSNRKFSFKLRMFNSDRNKTSLSLGFLSRSTFSTRWTFFSKKVAVQQPKKGFRVWPPTHRRLNLSSVVLG